MQQIYKFLVKKGKKRMLTSPRAPKQQVRSAIMFHRRKSLRTGSYVLISDVFKYTCLKDHINFIFKKTLFIHGTEYFINESEERK